MNNTEIYLKVSLIIPTYNKAHHLEILLKSIKNQTVKEHKFEVIIVNDGSTDNTLEVADKYQKKMSNLKIVSKKNTGIGSARNTGLIYASGDLISFIADDYILDKEYIYKLSKTFINKDVHGVRPYFDSFGKTTTELAFQSILKWSLGMSGPMPKTNDQGPIRPNRALPWSGAAMTRRETFELYGHFSEANSTGEDTEYAVRLRSHNIVIHLYPESLFKIQHRKSLFSNMARLFIYSWSGSQIIASQNNQIQKIYLLRGVKNLLNRSLELGQEESDNIYKRCIITTKIVFLFSSRYLGRVLAHIWLRIV